MATKKTSTPNHVPSRRPLDSIDSLRPSSLPPELGSLDMSWDDDPRSVGAIDLLQHSELDIDVDENERTTAVPSIPIDQLVEATMAEADARELEAGSDLIDPVPVPTHEPWSDHAVIAAPTAGASGHSVISGVDPLNLAQTQPAPARRMERSDVPVTVSSHDREHLDQDGILPISSRPPAPEIRSGRLDPKLATRSMAGPVGPSSSRPPARIDSLLSSPPTLRRTELDELRNQMKDRYATGDFSGALELADGLLAADNGDLEAQRFATSCRDVLTQMLVSRIGSFQQIVEVSLTAEELRWLTLDHRAGFFLSLVDGSSTIEELLDISGMARLESLRILSALIEQRVLRLLPP